MFEFIKNVFIVIVNYIIPIKCISCSDFIENNNDLCASCWNKLTFITKPYCNCCCTVFNINISNDDMLCIRCINNNSYYDKIRSVIIFNNDSRKLIHDFKYKDKTSVASIFSKLIYNRYNKEIIDIDIIVPVPMHKIRRILRNYNQAQVLASALEKLIHKPLLNNLLVKNTWTKSQTGLSKSKRLKNILNTISINKNYNIKDKKILLVDDVITTSSTVNECSKVLKKNGASKVYVVSIART